MTWEKQAALNADETLLRRNNHPGRGQLATKTWPFVVEGVALSLSALPKGQVDFLFPVVLLQRLKQMFESMTGKSTHPSGKI